MRYIADPRVDAYISALPDWQQAICREVRDLVHAADPDVVETIQAHTTGLLCAAGNILPCLAAKDHVNVFLYDGAIVPDPDRIITGGHGNTTARTLRTARRNRQTRQPSPPCSSTSLPTTEPAAGAS